MNESVTKTDGEKAEVRKLYWWAKLIKESLEWNRQKAQTWTKVYSTQYSQAVTHPSTNWARRCLASVIGRELAFSTWYGRRQLWWLILAVLCEDAGITKQGHATLAFICMFIVLFLDILTCFSIWQQNHTSPSSLYLSSIIEHIFFLHNIVSMQLTFLILFEEGLVGLAARFQPSCRVWWLIQASFNGIGLFAENL